MGEGKAQLLLASRVQEPIEGEKEASLTYSVLVLMSENKKEYGSIGVLPAALTLSHSFRVATAWFISGIACLARSEQSVALALARFHYTTLVTLGVTFA